MGQGCRVVCHSAESRWEAWGNGGSGTFWVRLKQGGRLSPVLLVGLELPDYAANWVRRDTLLSSVSWEFQGFRGDQLLF